MSLDFRLNILQDTGQLSAEGYKTVTGIIKLMDEEWEIKLDEDNGAMLVTHLVVALRRIENDETVDKLDDTLLKQLGGSKNCSEAVKIIARIEELFGVFPENERGYILLHVCTLLEKE